MGTLSLIGSQGLLLVGHGTRDDRGLEEHRETLQQLERLLPDVVVSSAFLELVQPDISIGIDELVDRGVERIVVSPLLLFAGGHAKRDIPVALEAARVRHSGTAICAVEPLGCHPTLLRLSVHRFHGALHETESTTSTRLIVVGRGGSDKSAAAALRQYAGLLAKRVNVDRWDVAFIAVAQPSLRDVLIAAARSGSDDLVVQPHLLFQGEVLERMRIEISTFQKQFPAIRLRTARHLGPSRLLSDAIAEVARLTKFSRSTN